MYNIIHSKISLHYPYNSSINCMQIGSNVQYTMCMLFDLQQIMKFLITGKDMNLIQTSSIYRSKKGTQKSLQKELIRTNLSV